MWTYNYTDELYHYGVKGMKWGVRRVREDAPIKKSRATKTLERLAKSGEKHEKIQRSIGNIASANQWKREAEANRKAAKESYDRDVFKKTASKQEQKALKKAQAEWDEKVRNRINVDVEFRSRVMTKANKITSKYNDILEKEGLAGTQAIFAETMRDQNKRARYEELKYQYQQEVGKAYTDEIVKVYGERPAIPKR